MGSGADAGGAVRAVQGDAGCGVGAGADAAAPAKSYSTVKPKASSQSLTPSTVQPISDSRMARRLRFSVSPALNASL